MSINVTRDKLILTLTPLSGSIWYISYNALHGGACAISNNASNLKMYLIKSYLEWEPRINATIERLKDE